MAEESEPSSQEDESDDQEVLCLPQKNDVVFVLFEDKEHWMGLVKAAFGDLDEDGAPYKFTPTGTSAKVKLLKHHVHVHYTDGTDHSVKFTASRYKAKRVTKPSEPSWRYQKDMPHSQ